MTLGWKDPQAGQEGGRPVEEPGLVDAGGMSFAGVWKKSTMRILGIILLVGGILLGYFGYRKYDDNKANVKIGDLEITAKDQGNTTTAYVMMGAGIVSILVGAVLLSRKTT